MLTVHTVLAHGRIFIHVLVKLVHLVLSVIEVVEDDPNQGTCNNRSDGETSKHPHDGGIVQERVQRLGNGGTESVGK